MNILFITNELPPASFGGIGACVLTTARGLARKGHKITVLGIYKENIAWKYPDIDVVPITRIAPRGISRVVSRYFLERYAIYSKIKELHKVKKFDIVEWQDAGGWYFKQIPEIVDVVRNHGPLMSHRLAGVAKINPIIERQEVNMLRSIKNWIGVSDWFMNEWLRITQAKPINKCVIYNPVDTDLFMPRCVSDWKEKWILYAGSLMERKGVYQLAKAANTFLRVDPQLRLVIAGRDQWDGVNIIESILDKNIRGQVFLKHPMPQHVLASFMNRSMIFAMPSLLESFGNVWAESMAAGLPVIGSKLSCGPEIVPDKLAGILVDPNNVNEISESVITILRDQSLRDKMSKFAREYALEMYSAQISIEKTEKFYYSCL